MFQDSRLRAGPRPPLPTPNTSAAMPRHADALVPDTAGSDAAGIPCPAHWPANSGSLATAAIASLPAGTHRCNNAPAPAAAETSTRNPSTGTSDAADADSDLDCSLPRRDTVDGPREFAAPARSSLGAERQLHSEAPLQTPVHWLSTPDPAVNLSVLPHLNRHAPLRPCPSRRHAPLAAMPMAHPRRHAPPTAIQSCRTGASGTAKMAPRQAATNTICISRPCIACRRKGSSFPAKKAMA